MTQIMTHLRGKEVELATVEGRVKGVIAGITGPPNCASFADVHALELEDVWDLSVGAHIHGIGRFHTSEILEWRWLSVVDEEEWTAAASSSESVQPEIWSSDPTGKTKTKSSSDAVRNIEVPYVVLDSIGVTEFLVAVGHIRRQKAVGFSLAGSRVGRRGRLSWVVVSTPDLVYLFDIFSLGNEGFKHGLKDVFSSDSVVKVTHDCRHAADMLHRQYGVDLVNVFDTQVADAMIEAKEKRDLAAAQGSVSSDGGAWPKSVKSLPATCEKYLRVADKVADKLDVQRLNSDS